VENILKEKPPVKINAGNPDHRGNTVLYLAAANKNLPMVKVLLAHGADPNVKNADNFTALMIVTSAAIKKALKESTTVQPPASNKSGPEPSQSAGPNKKANPPAARH